MNATKNNCLIENINSKNKSYGSYEFFTQLILLLYYISLYKNICDCIICQFFFNK